MDAPSRPGPSDALAAAPTPASSSKTSSAIGGGLASAAAPSPGGSLNPVAGSSTAAAPSKAQLRKEKERRSLGNELAGHRKKPRLEELRSDSPGSSKQRLEYDEDYYDPQGSQPRNFTTVRYHKYRIQTGYFSPYPISAAEDPAIAASQSAGFRSQTTPRDPSTPTRGAAVDAGQASLDASASHPSSKQAGHVPKSSLRAHGRTSDLFAGGLGTAEEGARGELFVCEGCFKYTKEYPSFDRHRRSCETRHPPGRKVYESGTRAIWEVDGSEAGLYCQNLSLFGKLFIHTKTVFFSVEDFTFYVLTDSSGSQKDLAVGFFSKEKVSYEGFNLNCIITFPPYQRLGHGRLMIEFSYVLTRGRGPPGTPERPLSDQGLRGYLSYWSWAVARALAEIFEEVPKAGKRGLESEGRPTSFEEIAGRAHMRPDDVALTLRDTPIVRRARDREHAHTEILITREAFDEFVATRRIQPEPLMEASSVLL